MKVDPSDGEEGGYSLLQEPAAQDSCSRQVLHC